MTYLLAFGLVGVLFLFIALTPRCPTCGSLRVTSLWSKPYVWICEDCPTVFRKPTLFRKL
jgi:ribosomal protein L37AE/L43A